MKKRRPIRSKAILNSARDEPCTVCGANDGTTVFCHLNESWAGKGAGQKADDIAGFFGCHRCHLGFDGYLEGNYAISWLDVAKAMYRTWRRLIERGIIKIIDHEP